MKKLFFIAILQVIFSSFLIFADYNSLDIPDSAQIRKQLTERWFEASLTVVRNNLPEIYHDQTGKEFQVRLEEDESTFNIFVSPHQVINVDVYSDKGVHVITQDVYPGDVAGSFVLVRSKADGKASRARFYFLKNSEVYVQFRPHGKMALVDLVIFGNYAARGVSTGVPFSKIWEMSFEQIMHITKDKLPWDYVLTDVNLYHSVQQMSAVIEEKLPNIKYVDDAMYDENGKLVHITTGKPFLDSEVNGEVINLSSAGFLKWVADGLIEPLAGGKLKREPLIKETVSVKSTGYQGILSNKYSLYFSLDWIRNLASAIISVYTGNTYYFNQSGVDVVLNPFAQEISAQGVANTVTFIENTGYTVGVLKSLLYVLANTEPGTVYFGAVRVTDKSVSPEIMVFNDCVIFLPYFNEDGGFDCSVFMNGRKSSLEEFFRWYADDYVYLTRVKSSEQFYPQ